MKQQDLADLKQLIDFLKEHQIAEFDLDRGDLKIRLMGHLAASQHHAAAHPAGSAPAGAEEADPNAGLHVVKSPIVGTYYGSPSPGAAAFVSPGDHVDKGQVICIVEAMKLMNEIESDAAGEIVKCFVTNGQPIEFGQPLFSIRLG